jgi:hypothetical protein
LVFLLALAAGGLWANGRGFYSLGVAERVDHPAFRLLSPGELVGHGYGIVGTALILTNLLYLVRRRFPRLPVGSLRAWLNLHTTTGLFGGVLVIFHSAFQFRTPIATVTMWALVVVILTGIVGRFIHAFTSEPDLSVLDAHYRTLDNIRAGMGSELRRRLSVIERVEPKGRSLFSVLFTMPRWRREARARKRTVAETLAELGVDHKSELQLLGAQISDMTSVLIGDVRARAAGSLVRGWRSIHRLAAVLMVLLVCVHIFVAWQYGYRWIFSENAIVAT